MKIVFLLYWSLLVVASNAQVIIEPYPDNSLYPEQYQSFGMPKSNELWNAAEYKRARKVIKGFYDIDKWSLPRKNSQYSGSLFERMVSIDNLEIINNQSEPIQKRLEEHDEIINSTNILLNLYYERSATEQRFGAEVLTILVFSAKSTNYSIDIIKELQALMISRSQSNKNLDLVHDNMVLGIIKTIEERLKLIEVEYFNYNQIDIEYFSTEISIWIPSVIEHINPHQLNSILSQVKQIAANHPYPNVQNDFKVLQKTLKKGSQQKD